MLPSWTPVSPFCSLPSTTQPPALPSNLPFSFYTNKGQTHRYIVAFIGFSVVHRHPFLYTVLISFLFSFCLYIYIYIYIYINIID